MEKQLDKIAIIDYRKRVYRISPAGLHAIMELTRRRVDREQAIGFILRQEGYDIRPVADATAG